MIRRSFETLRKLFKHKHAMATIRYFPNNLPDYESAGDDVDLNQEKLVNSLRSMTYKIAKEFPATDKNAQNGIYLGTAGVAFMFYRLSKIAALKTKKLEYLNSALEYIQPALHVATKSENQTQDLPSFLLGNGGIYVVAAAIFNAMKDMKNFNNYREKYLRVATICKNPFLRCGDDELFVGRAGYICGALWLSRETNTPLALHDLYDVCSAVVASGRTYSKHHSCICPLMYAYYETEYLGAAHGLCSILQMLLCVPGYIDAHPDDTRYIKESVDYLLELQLPSGNFPCATDELNMTRKEELELVHWCHGAPGVVYLMARAYIVWGDQKYLDSCIKCGEVVWNKGLLRKGPGICHGIAGNGYVFLLLYRLTNDKKYLHRAMQFAEFLDYNEFKQVARTPDNPYSLYEGIAGTACFIGDLLQPTSAVFPFSDIF